MDSSIEDAIYEVNSNHLSIQFRGCCPSYLMAHYPSFAPILHCLIRERERDNVRYEVATVAMMLVVVALVMK